MTTICVGVQTFFLSFSFIKASTMPDWTRGRKFVNQYHRMMATKKVKLHARLSKYLDRNTTSFSSQSNCWQAPTSEPSLCKLQRPHTLSMFYHISMIILNRISDNDRCDFILESREYQTQGMDVFHSHNLKILHNNSKQLCSEGRNLSLLVPFMWRTDHNNTIHTSDQTINAKGKEALLTLSLAAH